MVTNWSFGQKLGAGFTITGLVLVVVATFGHHTVDRLIEDQAWVDHTELVRRNLRDLSGLMKDAETGQRGFILTGDEDFLQPHAEAVPRIASTYDRLSELVADNPEQERRLEAARPLIEAKLAGIGVRIAERRNNGLDAAAAIVQAGDGRAAMAELIGILDEMDEVEADLLEQRRTEAQSSADLANDVMVWGSALGLLFICVVGTVIARSLTQRVGSAVRHVQSSSAELQSAANQQASGAKQQSTAMEEITTTISELLASSRQIAESAQRVAEIANDTVHAAKTGRGTVDRTQVSIGEIRKQVDVVVEHMLDLGRKSQEIGAVVEIVSELSEQTNILAINATIEAVGSGEAGKRFAVVADEIRKLADRVGGSSKEIRTLIEDVRKAVNTTVMATEKGSKAVEAGARESGSVTTALDHIEVLVATTTEAAREIELSTKQQATAVEQVNAAISGVAQASRESETSTVQTLQTALQLTSMSRELMRLIQAQAA
jgi:methyl-accepting chemotaxis protein